MVKILGVDMGGDNVTPELENYDLNFTPPQNEQQAPNQEPTMTEPTANTSDPAISAPAPVAVLPPIGQRRSTRTRQPVQRYVPSTIGKTYSYTATQLAANETNSDKEKEKPNPYSDMFLMMKNGTYEYDLQVVEYIMTQLTLKNALKLWGNNVQLAVEAEVKQLHWQNSFKPVNWNKILPKKKKAILESHIFFKKKKLGEVKARKVASGNKQHDFIDKEDASSPTVTQDSVVLTCMIDAKENRDVATIDIPNAFIQTVVKVSKDRVIIQLQGLMVNILEKIEPHVYGPYVTFDKRGNKQLLVECLSAIYGTMVASL